LPPLGCVVAPHCEDKASRSVSPRAPFVQLVRHPERRQLRGPVLDLDLQVALAEKHTHANRVGLSVTQCVGDDLADHQQGGSTTSRSSAVVARVRRRRAVVGWQAALWPER